VNSPGRPIREYGPIRISLFSSGIAAVVLLLLVVPEIRLQAAGLPPQESRKQADLAGYDALITSENREHWSFQPLKAPKVPEVRQTTWARNPIDRFVLAGLERKGWAPRRPARAHALLRRLFLDVTGLPPSPDEQAAFLNDLAREPDAVERWVERLLARPAYGERWARYWLDLVRYAETNGYERDATKPFAWRYRDYVIRAFNTDKPFNRFVMEQLAGDELPAAEVTAETLIATGYYRLGPWDDEPADPKQDRYDQLDDIVNTTSEVFLGLTMGCARCHNHKFEPLTMHDYYRMVAIFEPLQRPVNGRMERTLPLENPTPIVAARSQGKSNAAPQGYFLHEPSTNPPVSHLLFRGQAASPGPVVGPGVPAVLVKAQPNFPQPEPGAKTSRRRVTLARWVASTLNPLTARVIVNRVWQNHFGVGLVRTSSDLGTMGEPPTHPELLDWLASWFIEHGWSLKGLNRLILTSNTYRLSSESDSRYAAEDPQDDLLWRMPYRRLEVEVIRDTMLAASGRLNRTMYGPSVYPAIPPSALAGHSDPDKVWRPSDEVSASRRTIYAFLKRSLVVPMLEVLDLCDTARSTARRNVTSVPTQALTLLNGGFVNQQAEWFADRLEREAGPDRAAQVERAYLLSVCRSPSQVERTTLLAFLDRESRNRLADARRAQGARSDDQARHEALVQLCRAIFNMNEFVYPD
jgi:hypothetical protein